MNASAHYEAIIEQGRTLSELQRLYWVAGVQYGRNHVPVRRDNEKVAMNFTEVEGFDLKAPAFVNRESVPTSFADGAESPTDDITMGYFLQSIASRNDWATYHTAAFQSEEGRSVPYIYLSASSKDVSDSIDSSGKLKVWAQGGVHGNEPAGDQSLLALVGKMDADQTWTRSILTTMDILILPRYNLDGVAYFQRTSASYFDLNRDHIKLARQETRDIRRLFNSFRAHVVIDMHEFGASTRYGGCYVHASDALYSPAKNLNIDQSIRRLSEELFAPNIGSTLDSAGLRWESYVTGSSKSTMGSTIKFAEASSDAKIGRNAMGLTQSISFLCETRGIGLADQHFHRRTVTGLLMAESIIQTTADNAEQVHRTITEGIDNFISSDADIIVTDSTTYVNRTFQMIDVRDGSIVQAPVQFASSTPTIANLTRARPEAYIIPHNWVDLVGSLLAGGLEVTTMSQMFRGTVEVLNIISVSFDDTYYEGVIPVTVTTSAVEKEIELPAGSYTISTRQRNAALAFAALEPENPDSFVSFNIIPVKEGDEYPVFRLLAE